jgi:hypothetical protein
MLATTTTTTNTSFLKLNYDYTHSTSLKSEQNQVSAQQAGCVPNLLGKVWTLFPRPLVMKKDAPPCTRVQNKIKKEQRNNETTKRWRARSNHSHLGFGARYEVEA